MPRQTYLLVEGVIGPGGVGHPVTNPHAPSENPARFAGWRVKTEPHPDPSGLIDHYEQVLDTLVAHADLRKAARLGFLKVHGECVARNHDEARATFATKFPLLFAAPPAEGSSESAAPTPASEA